MDTAGGAPKMGKGGFKLFVHHPGAKPDDIVGWRSHSANGMLKKSMGCELVFG